MNIFDDYKNWKDENLTLLKKLKKDDSSILSYIEPVSIVLDYLYKQSKKRELNEDESYSFSFGFNFIVNRFSLIKDIYEINCQNDYEILKQMTQTISLYLHVIDIIELVGKDSNLTKIENYLNDLFVKCNNINNDNLDKIYLYLDSKYYDDDLEFVESIFYQIADLYNLNDDENTFFDFMNEKISGDGHDHSCCEH